VESSGVFALSDAVARTSKAATRLRRPAPAWLWLLPVAAASLAYANSLAGGFVWDDQRLVLDDRAITSWNRLTEIFAHDFFFRSEDDLPYGYYRPLVTTSYLIDYSLWGLQPFGYHLTNVLLHAACAALVALLAVDLGLTFGAAAGAAVLFAIHPIHTENVAWISGRTDVVAFLFTAIALLALARADRNLNERDEPARIWLTVGLAAFAAALLAKEMSIVLLFWAAVVLRYVRGRNWRDIARLLSPLAAVVVLYLIWRFVVLDIDMPGQADHNPLLALLTAPPTLLRYLAWLVFPYPLHAYVQNPYVRTLTDPRLWAASALLVATGWWCARRASRAVQVLALMLVASFLPVLNFVRVAGPADMGNIMAERFCYFPSFPFVLLAAHGAVSLWQAKPAQWRLPATFAIAVLALTLTLVTVRRNRDWADERTFLDVTLAQSPEAVLLWGNLARLHLRSRDLRAADTAIAEVEQRKPGSYAALSTRASFLVLSDRIAEAIPLQQRIVEDSRRGNATARNNLAYLYRKTGDSQRAMGILQKLVASDAGYADVFFNIAAIYRERGDRDAARKHLRFALNDRPNSRAIATDLATLEMEDGDFAEAEQIYRRMLDIYRDDVRLLNNLALVCFKGGDRKRALDLWQRAIELDPTYQNARNNYEQALAE